VRLKAQLCVSSIAKIVGANPAEGMHSLLFYLLCAVFVEVSATSLSFV
jgi:hypothetical protein